MPPPYSKQTPAPYTAPGFETPPPNPLPVYRMTIHEAMKLLQRALYDKKAGNYLVRIWDDRESVEIFKIEGEITERPITRWEDIE